MEFGIIIDTREKGVFLVFKVPEYVSCPAEYYGMLQKLLKAFQAHKDESISAKAASDTKQKFNHMDINRDERVAAYLEAKQRRAFVASQAPMYWNAPVQLPIALASGSNSYPQHAPNSRMDVEMEHKYTDYPEEPSEIPTEHTGINSRTPQTRAPVMAPQNTGPAPFRPGTDVQAHIRNNYDAIEKRLQQGNKVKFDRSAAQLAQDQNSYLAQIAEYRNRVRNNNHHMIQRRDHPREMTWGQLEQKVDVENQEIMGKQCLEFTNQFRKEHGLPPLKWEPKMFQIGKSWIDPALRHSMDMGHGRVPFGHAGFNQRADDMPFSKRSAGENVAYIGGVERAAIPRVGEQSEIGNRHRLDQLTWTQEESLG